MLPPPRRVDQIAPGQGVEGAAQTFRVFDLVAVGGTGASMKAPV